MDLWLSMSIALLMGSDGKLEVFPVANETHSYEECQNWVEMLDSLPRPKIDPITKKPLVAKFYVCVPLS